MQLAPHKTNSNLTKFLANAKKTRHMHKTKIKIKVPGHIKFHRPLMENLKTALVRGYIWYVCTYKVQTINSLNS